MTGAPSGKTSFVVVGENAGASKLDKIKKASIKTITEDEFLEMIATRKGAKLDEKALKAQEKESKKIEDAAKEMEKKEKEEEKLRKRKEQAMAGTGVAVKSVPLSITSHVSEAGLTGVLGRWRRLRVSCGRPNTPLAISRKYAVTRPTSNDWVYGSLNGKLASLSFNACRASC